MGIMSKVVKLGIAKKVYDEARKPENQKRIKDALSSVRGKGRSKGTQPPR